MLRLLAPPSMARPQDCRALRNSVPKQASTMRVPPFRQSCTQHLWVLMCVKEDVKEANLGPSACIQTATAFLFPHPVHFPTGPLISLFCSHHPITPPPPRLREKYPLQIFSLQNKVENHHENPMQQGGAVPSLAHSHSLGPPKLHNTDRSP